MKVKSESEAAQSCPTLSDPMDCSVTYQAPLSMGFSRQEYWSGVPLPSPIGDYLRPNYSSVGPAHTMILISNSALEPLL